MNFIFFNSIFKFFREISLGLRPGWNLAINKMTILGIIFMTVAFIQLDYMRKNWVFPDKWYENVVLKCPAKKRTQLPFEISFEKQCLCLNVFGVLIGHIINAKFMR